MTCTTLTSRTCLDQFCQHLEDASWLTGMHQRFDNNCFWKSQDAWQTSEFATAICFFNITSLCELREDVFCWSKAVRPRRGKRWKPATRLTRGASTPLSWMRSSGCGFLVVLVAQARALRLSLGCVCVFVCVCWRFLRVWRVGCWRASAVGKSKPLWLLIAAIWFSGTLHYFDIQAMFVERSCSERSRVLYDKLRQRVVYVIMSWCCHCFLIFVTCKHTIPILILWFKVAPALWHHFCHESLKISEDAWFFTAIFCFDIKFR